MSSTPRSITTGLPEVRGLLVRLQRLTAKPLVSYVLVLALQLRVVWDIWEYKDFTAGDTSFYFIDAASWAHGLHENIVYSPLYDAIWGTILAVVHDVYAAAMVNRVAIVVAAALLVLAAMRALFSGAIALLIAVWWSLAPANFDVLYDVHLLGLLPVLVAALVVKRVPGRMGLGVALALFVADTVLLRNEMLVASAILAVAILIHEFRARRTMSVPLSAYGCSYAVPLLIASVLLGGAYWRSHIQGNTAVTFFEAKQETNFCEAYAFSYQQRYPSRVPGNAFLGCTAVTRHDFGSAMPSLPQAAVANPRALAGFVAWNVRLLPSGLEVALFGATHTGMNPAYPPPEQHRDYALVLSIALALLLALGLTFAWRDRTYWRRSWFPSRAWTLVVLGSAAIGTLTVVLLERPWAEYMYPLTIGVLTLAGLSASAVTRRLGVSRLLLVPACVLTLLLIILLPSYYSAAPRPIYEAVGRLEPIRRQLQRPGSVLVAAADENEICNYLARDFEHYCGSASWLALRAQIAAGATVESVLSRAKATAIYADASMVSDPSFSGLLASPRRAGWREVAGGSGPTGPWRVLIRAGAS